MENKKLTIEEYCRIHNPASKVREDAKQEICDNYCKYSEMSCYEHEEQLYIQCENCPLNRL